MTETNFSISSGTLSAEINPCGAQLFALRDKQNRDLLWNGDPAYWTGRAPILFPIIGALAKGQYRLDGRVYQLPRHGFARHRPFTCVEATPSTIRLLLSWDDETCQVYPFRFALEIAFRLTAASLSMTALVKNLDTQILPASFGFHPALRWPLPYGHPRADHRLVFDQNEPAPVRRLDQDGLVLPTAFPTQVAGRTLALRDDLFAADALIFDSPASRGLRYGASTGPQLQIDFPDMPMLGVWSKPGADFICIEPWHGIADPQGFAGDFRDKPGIFLVPPGGTQRCGMTITLCDA